MRSIYKDVLFSDNIELHFFFFFQMCSEVWNQFKFQYFLAHFQGMGEDFSKWILCWFWVIVLFMVSRSAN